MPRLKNKAKSKRTTLTLNSQPTFKIQTLDTKNLDNHRIDMSLKIVGPEAKSDSFPLPVSRRRMKRTRFVLSGASILLAGLYASTAESFSVPSQSKALVVKEAQSSLLTRSRCYRWKRSRENTSLRLSEEPNGNDNSSNNDVYTYAEYRNTYFENNDYENNNYHNGNFDNHNFDVQNVGIPTESYSESWEPTNGDIGSEPITPPETPSPDRAVGIVSELKANAALFAAFAYGSLNLPSTLTVSESKVTSVTTSLSISRPLPDSDLIRTFVVLDVCTLCLMISCVAASQLLIYRLTDGSYEEQKYVSKKNSRNSALGRLVTTYRKEFTIARLTFDLGLVSLLLAVGVRSLATFDEDIVVPILAVIGVTGVFLAVAYFTTYIEVFRTAENLKVSLYDPAILPFLYPEDDTEDDTEDDANDTMNFISTKLVLPFALISIGLASYFTLASVDPHSESNLTRLGPYEVTSGANKLKVVTERIDTDRAREKQRTQRAFELNSKAKKKAAEAAAKQKAEEEAKKKADDEARKKAEDEINKRLEREARRRAEEEAAKKSEEDYMKYLELEARRRAEEQANAASAAAQAKVDAIMMKKAAEAAAAAADSS